MKEICAALALCLVSCVAVASDSKSNLFEELPKPGQNAEQRLPPLREKCLKKLDESVKNYLKLCADSSTEPLDEVKNLVSYFSRETSCYRDRAMNGLEILSYQPSWMKRIAQSPDKQVADAGIKVRTAAMRIAGVNLFAVGFIADRSVGAVEVAFDTLTKVIARGES